MTDADQILLWWAALCLSDNRMAQPRALRKAIFMILNRDRTLAAEVRRRNPAAFNRKA